MCYTAVSVRCLTLSPSYISMFDCYVSYCFVSCARIFAVHCLGYILFIVKALLHRHAYVAFFA